MARYFPLFLVLFFASCNHDKPVPPVIQPKPDTVDVRFHTYCPSKVTHVYLWLDKLQGLGHDSIFDITYTGPTVRCFDTTIRVKRGRQGGFNAYGGQAVYVEWEGKQLTATASSSEDLHFKIE